MIYLNGKLLIYLNGKIFETLLRENIMSIKVNYFILKFRENLVRKYMWRLGHLLNMDCAIPNLFKLNLNSWSVIPFMRDKLKPSKPLNWI